MSSELADTELQTFENELWMEGSCTGFEMFDGLYKLPYPDWILDFNRNFFSIREQDWILFIQDVVPDTNDNEGLNRFKEDPDNEQWAKELFDFLENAREDSFIKVLYYREWFKERVQALATEYHRTNLLERIEHPNETEKAILKFFY